jgi:uridine kinase
VIAGPNGSGKTTITSKILKHEWLENALYINPDQVAQDRLLFRMTDGQPFKQYTDDIPEWALTILK